MSAIAGYATASATRAYTKAQGGEFPPGHYSDFLATGIALSSLGVGTFGGAATDAVDAQIAQIVARALESGLNVIDTATHYRYGRSARAVGAGLKQALAAGVPREAVFLISKGGFLLFPDGPPRNINEFFQREIVAKGLGAREDFAGKAHVLSPAHLDRQIDLSREAIGVETLDAFIVDQPEVQIAEHGKPELIRKLDRAFVALERAVQSGRIRYYGVSSFHSFRAHTDDKLFLSLASLVALAERAAQEVFGDGAAHHFAIVQLPFNAVMLEGFARFNQVTGQGNEASTLQAALQLGLYTMASHSLFKGHLGKQSLDAIQRALPKATTHAQRALQFNRSTPGLGTSLVGVSQGRHLDDVLAAARLPLMAKQAYLSLFQKA